MKRPLLLAVVLGCGLVASAGAIGCAAHVDTAAATASLDRVDREFSQAVAARGHAGFVEFVAPEAISLQAGGPAVRGRDAFAASWAPIFAPGVSLVWQPTDAFVAAAGDLGYTIGTYELHVPGDDGQPIVHRGKYITVWKKQADGSWKVVADAGNSSP